MSSVLTPQEYLAREREAEFRSEFYRGEMFAMAPTNWYHAIIKSHAAGEMGNQLENGPGCVLTSDMRTKVAEFDFYTYPDVVVVCDKPQFEDELRDTLLNPCAIVEIYSDSTEEHDRGLKFGNYRQIPSLQEYVMIAQDEPLVERHVRQPDNSWLMTEFRGLTQTFVFASIPVKIALTEIYRGVEFPENAG